MAAKLMKQPISAPQVTPTPTPTPKMMMISSYKPISTTHSRTTRRFRHIPIKVADHGSALVQNDEDESSLHNFKPQVQHQLKTQLYEALQGINRGIFGVPSAKKSEIAEIVKLLESMNPTPEPTSFLDKMGGCWKLVYSTITILGSKRTKLGLRDFISLGDFLQTIDVAEKKAVNVIGFNVRGLNLFNGQLKIESSFQVASKSRVDIKYNKSTITPDQLMNVFRKNFDLLLGIFNPEGWLEITYVDDTLKVGRDDKGNFFILERWEEKRS